MRPDLNVWDPFIVGFKFSGLDRLFLNSLAEQNAHLGLNQWFYTKKQVKPENGLDYKWRKARLFILKNQLSAITLKRQFFKQFFPRMFLSVRSTLRFFDLFRSARTVRVLNNFGGGPIDYASAGLYLLLFWKHVIFVCNQLEV